MKPAVHPGGGLAFGGAADLSSAPMPTPPPRFVAPPDSLLDRLALSPALRALARQSMLRSYRKGVLLIQEGDVGDTIYLLLSGRVRLYASAQAQSGGGSTERQITFGLHGPGELVGEMSLDGGPRAASAITTEATCAGVLTRDLLIEQMERHPALALELLTQVIGRARSAIRDARNMALLDSYGRLSMLLDELAAPGADGIRPIDARLTHSEIASRIGCSREMVSRLLKDLERGGYIDQMDQRLTLRRPLPLRW
jgi:CRP/FNR family cyclic AMP-dependent transcriptional regulator